MKETYTAYIRSCGMYVPDKVVTNHDLPDSLNTSDEWIQKRSGIHERRYAETGVRTSDLAKEAVLNMLAKNEVTEEEIDCIIFATLSPDCLFPGTGLILQEKLGWAKRTIPCFDIRQQCSGFVYGMQMAQAFVECGMYANVILVGAEVHSHGLDYSERGRAVTVLFGDAAACVTVSRAHEGDGRIIYTENHGDGKGAFNGVHCKLFDIGKIPLVYYDPLDAETNKDMYPEMPAPKNLFTNAVRRMCEVLLSAAWKHSLNMDDIDWVLPHQANKRINELMAEYLSLPDEKVLYNIHKYGNTTAATIPLLFAEYTDNGTIKRGDMIAFVAFGSGFTWGASLVEY